MSDLQQAVEELKAAARPFRAMLALVDRLDALGDVEQVERETAARVAGLKAEEGALRRELDLAKASITDAGRKAAEIVALAQGDAADARDAAQAQAAEIIERARAQAHAIRDAAVQDASAARAEADTARAEAQAAEQQCRDLEERISNARSAITSLMQGV